MSLFPISKRLTFFLDYFVYAVFKVHARSTRMQIAQPLAGVPLACRSHSLWLAPGQLGICFADTSRDIRNGTFLYATKELWALIIT